MFGKYILISYVVMALIFLRQISIFKKPNKINYAPFVIGIGSIASVVHFIISTKPVDVALKESLVPLLIALLLFIVMNMLHQIQTAQTERQKLEFFESFIDQLKELKTLNKNISDEMVKYVANERELQQEIQAKFAKDLETLTTLLENQHKFMDMFEEMKRWHSEITEAFVNFTEIKLPEVDSIIHKHIDYLRISEAEHFKELQQDLKEYFGHKQTILEDIKELKKSFLSLSDIPDTVSKESILLLSKHLNKFFDGFKNEILFLTNQAEGMKTIINESENKIYRIKEQSFEVENNLDTITKEIDNINSFYEYIQKITSAYNELFEKISVIKKEFETSIYRLNSITQEFKDDEKEYIDELNKKVELLAKNIEEKIEISLEELRKHYHITHEEITDSVKVLAKKAQIQKGYDTTL